jgi:hypothetical protein
LDCARFPLAGASIAVKTRSSPIEQALVEAVLAAVEGDPT